MHCQECGTKLRAKAKFCPQCGAGVSELLAEIGRETLEEIGRVVLEDEEDEPSPKGPGIGSVFLFILLFLGAAGVFYLMAGPKDIFSNRAASPASLPRQPQTTSSNGLEDLPRDGRYFATTGADCKHFRGELLNKPVRLCTTVRNPGDDDFAANRVANLRTLDKKFRVVLNWSDCPRDLQNQFRSKGLSSGNSICVWGYVTKFGRNDFLYLRVEKWARM